ncbi:aspartate/glutamate racemase family protein [Rhodococcus sp. NPDC057529]|uniref:maleate cis-trans isomerase family protein n=1 Tax=Rhodococcus sp. NPDC057529 TaxID=3346158 RepID=UPI00366DACA3
MRNSSSRVGLLVPSSNTTMEIDLARALTPYATVHVARMHLADCDAAAENRMLDHHVEPAVRDLASARPDVVVFGCTSAGALRGNDFDAKLCREIGLKTDAIPVSTLQAAQIAIAATGGTRVAVVTPYPDELTNRVAGSLINAGLSVPSTGSMGLLDNFAIAAVTTPEIVDFTVRSVGETEIDTVFLSCTNLAASQAASQIEDALGVPVVTSNRAVVASVLSALEIHPEVRGE